MHEQPLRRGAGLPGAPERGVRNARRGAIEIAVFAHERGGDAAELERDRAQPDVAVQLLADLGAAGEGEEADPLVLDEPAADFAARALHEVDVTRRQTGVEQDLSRAARR